MASFLHWWRNIFLHEVECGIIIKTLFWQFFVTKYVLIEIKYLMRTWTDGLPARCSCWNSLCESLTPGHVPGNMSKELKLVWLCGRPLRELRPHSVKSVKCCRLEPARLITATSCLPAQGALLQGLRWLGVPGPSPPPKENRNLARQRLRKEPDCHAPSWGGFTLATYVMVTHQWAFAHAHGIIWALSSYHRNLSKETASETSLDRKIVCWLLSVWSDNQLVWERAWFLQSAQLCA